MWYAAKVFLLLRDLIHSKKSEMEDSQTYWTALHMIAFDQFCSFACNSAHFAQKVAQKYTLVTLLNCGQTVRRRESFIYFKYLWNFIIWFVCEFHPICSSNCGDIALFSFAKFRRKVAWSFYAKVPKFWRERKKS